MLSFLKVNFVDAIKVDVLGDWNGEEGMEFEEMHAEEALTDEGHVCQRGPRQRDGGLPGAWTTLPEARAA